MGCSGVLRDVPGVFQGCSGLLQAVTGVFRGSSRVFWGCSGVFRVLQTPHHFYLFIAQVLILSTLIADEDFNSLFCYIYIYIWYKMVPLGRGV